MTVHWLDVVLQVQGAAGQTLATTLADKVRKVSPAYADRLTDWKNMNLLVSRVAPETYYLVEEFMREHETEEPPVLQSWMHQKDMSIASYAFS